MLLITLKVVKNFMKNKNILELCLSPNLGGLELFLLSCYNDFSKKTSCKVVVAPNQKLDKSLNSKDKLLLQRNKFFPIIPALKLAGYIDKYDIDIIHFHWTRDMITVVLAKLLCRKRPKLIQSRHMGMTRFKDDFYHRWLYKKIDLIHAVTLKVKEQIVKFVPESIRPRVETIYLGTKVSEINHLLVKKIKDKYQLQDEFIVGTVGRIEEGKGQHILIDAINKLKECDIKCLIVGSAMNDQYLEELKEKIKRLGLENKVIFTGFTKNINEFMQVFDVNVLATKNETFGLVVIEAMVNKVAMIATNNGGPLEIIDDNVDGLLFDGSSEDLSEKIKFLFENKEFKNSLAISGYEKVQKKFNMDFQMKKIYECLNES